MEEARETRKGGSGGDRKNRGVEKGRIEEREGVEGEGAWERAGAAWWGIQIRDRQDRHKEGRQFADRNCRDMSRPNEVHRQTATIMFSKEHRYLRKGWQLGGILAWLFRY